MRDAETGLDYFGARYNASGWGRFMTPDPSPRKLAPMPDPQDWDLYAYATDNPTSATDPTGMETTLLTYGAFGPGLSNQFGHSALRINNSHGDFVYSFGPDSRGRAYVWKVPTKVYLARMWKASPGRKLTEQVLKFKTDGKRESAVQARLEGYLKSQAKEKKAGTLSKYNAVFDNCSEFAAWALGAAGVREGSLAPGELEYLVGKSGEVAATSVVYGPQGNTQKSLGVSCNGALDDTCRQMAEGEARYVGNLPR